MTGLFAARQDLSPKRLLSSMIGAARFNADVLKQLRDDPRRTLQSILLVPLMGFCYGIGPGFNGFLTAGLPTNETPLVLVLVIGLGLISAGIIAILWSVTNFLIVTRLFNRTISYSSLTRPFLFSWTPGVLFILVLSPNPFVSEGFRILATAWVAVASIFAMRHAGGLTVQQSMITFILSILILVFAQIVLESLLPLIFT